MFEGQQFKNQDLYYQKNSHCLERLQANNLKEIKPEETRRNLKASL